MSSLRPDKDIHKFLISTPSRFVGEFESPDVLITHVWSGVFSQTDRHALNLQPGPYCRNYYIIVCNIPLPEQKEGQGLVYPNFRSLGEHFCACLSFFFGKRFDFHGLIESNGMFQAPDLSNVRFVELSYSGPYNHESRKDLGIELNLAHFGRISRLFLDPSLNRDFRNVLFAAARFYHRSLQIFDLEPDVAYLDLITCGEILCNHTNYPDTTLYDPDVLAALDKLRVVPDGGEEAYGRVKGSLRQIKRKFTNTILDLLNDYFFTNTEAPQNIGKLNKSAAHPMWKEGGEEITIERRIKAAYDLRSQYVHTGVDFSSYVLPMRPYLNETQVGMHTFDSKKMRDAVFLAPTYVGMERIMRYCLVRFTHLHGITIDSRLDGLPAPPFLSTSTS
ncbi:MAG TPA: hypothetical protein VH592_09605 [Gemmataceae bacterium]|jgi:hypothetical protein